MIVLVFVHNDYNYQLSAWRFQGKYSTFVKKVKFVDETAEIAAKGVIRWQGTDKIEHGAIWGVPGVSGGVLDLGSGKKFLLDWRSKLVIWPFFSFICRFFSEYP